MPKLAALSDMQEDPWFFADAVPARADRFAERRGAPPMQWNHNFFIGPADGEWMEDNTRPILTLIPEDKDIGLYTPNAVPNTFTAPIGADGLFSLDDAELCDWD